MVRGVSAESKRLPASIFLLSVSIFRLSLHPPFDERFSGTSNLLYHSLNIYAYIVLASVDKEAMISNRLAIASVSLGRHSSHTLPRKIVAAAQNGISGLESTYPDLEFYSISLSTPILDAALKIKDLCAENGILLVSLAPFENFEGHVSPLKERLAKASSWLAIARTLGAEYLQVPSTYDSNVNGDHEVIVSELR